MVQISAIQSDITKLVVDVIVNAANTSLLGGSGVDGAIHRCAGPKLAIECRLLGGCKPGKAKITQGYNLAAKHVIHTVGPVWRDGTHNEEDVLISCYRECILLAEKYNLKSIAFPCISTGIYGYPKKLAAMTAINTALSMIGGLKSIETIYFSCFLVDNLSIYNELLGKRRVLGNGIDVHIAPKIP